MQLVIPSALITALNEAPIAAAVYQISDHACAFANWRQLDLWKSRFVVGKPFSETPEAIAYPVLNSLFRVALESGTPQTYSQAQSHYALAPIADDHGAPIGLVCYTTREALAEAAPADDRLTRHLDVAPRLRMILDGVPANIAVYEGPDHVCIYSSTLRTRHVGFDPIGKTAAVVARAYGGAGGLIEDLDAVFNSGKTIPRLELPIPYNIEGRVGVAYVTRVTTPWTGENGKVAGVVSLSIDITGQVQSREEARRAQRQLRELTDGLPIFVLLLDCAGRIKWANKPVMVRTDHGRDELIDTPVWDLRLWDEQTKSKVKQAIASAAAGTSVRFDAVLPDSTRTVLDVQFVPINDYRGTPGEIVCSCNDISERVRAEGIRDVLLRELQHRVKNTLATVQSVLRFSADTAESKEELISSMNGRLLAISRSHDALVVTEWDGQSLRRLVEAEVAAYTEGGDERFTYDGPDLVLPPPTALMMALGFHELATNAAKYGSFTVDTGRVAVRLQKDDGKTILEWKETGGPPPRPATRRGFGTFLLDTVIPAELGAEAFLEYLQDGFHYKLAWDAEDESNG